MRVLIFLFLTLAAGSVAAQFENPVYTSIEFFKRNQMATGELKTVLTENDIEGSPYLYDDFEKGTLRTTSNVSYEGIPLHYNIYNDELEFKTPDNQILAMSTPEIIERVTFEEYTLEYIPYILAKKIKRGFFILLLEGDVSLYAKPVIFFKQATEAGAYKDPTPPQFNRKNDSYFIRNGRDAAMEAENKKNLPDLFPDHRDEIESFIKKNKLSHRDPDDLKKLVSYYNSL